MTVIDKSDVSHVRGDHAKYTGNIYYSLVKDSIMIDSAEILVDYTPHIRSQNKSKHQLEYISVVWC